MNNISKWLFALINTALLSVLAQSALASSALATDTVAESDAVVQEPARQKAEEQAKQAAEAKAAKIKAKQEAKAEAARVKAEKEAKAQAEKQALAEAKAEAARQKAEQQAKAEAEKQAAAEDKRAAKAEAAKLKVEWKKVGENKILELTAYANPNTEAAPDGKVKMWGMYNYKSAEEVNGHKFMSTQFQDEYDCKQGQTRFLVSTAYSKNMGGGVVVFTNANAGKWQPVTPDSISDAMFKLACGKK